MSDMNTGLRFSLKGDYRAMIISISDSRVYWDAEFQYALRDIAGDTYPQAEYKLGGNDPYVTYRVIDRFGNEILEDSKPFNVRKPSRAEIKRVQAQIEALHNMANDMSIPSDRREFLRNFQLPNPVYMPECWRTTGLLNKRLYIVWGLTKDGKVSTFMPTSLSSRHWGDQQNRTSLYETLGMSHSEGPLSGMDDLHATSDGNVETNRGDVQERAPNLPPVEEKRRKSCLGTFFDWFFAILFIILLIFLLRGCLPGCDSSKRSVSKEKSVNVPEKHENDESTDVLNPDSGDMDNEAFPEESGGSHDTSDFQDQNDETQSEEVSNTQGGLPCNTEDSITSEDSNTSETGSDICQSPTGVDDDSTLDVMRALTFQFKVDDPKFLSEGDADVAHVQFSISPVDDLHEKKFEVRDWMINGEIVQEGKSATFIPENGLRYDKTYTVTAIVTVEGKQQRVEPYQWNMVDSPTWQILEVGRGERDERQYQLICCNSSAIKPIVKNWHVAFRLGGKNEGKNADFDVAQSTVSHDMMALDWGIGHYKGVYFIEIVADIEYTLRGRKSSVTHTEMFPFSHDSSVDGLTRAKYEVVIPNVYFCLAKLQDGSLINGTAFAISEKLLLSNYHVAVGGITESYSNLSDYAVVGPVTLTNVRGKTFYAKVVSHDRGRDLALLRICDKKGDDTDERLPGYLHLSEDDLVAGIQQTTPRHVFAVGYPKGTVCMGPPAFTDGKAEKIIQREYIHNGTRESYETILNYTNIKCGYSGGPLVDYQSQTILGVNFGGLVEQLEGHKAASLATSAPEVREGFPVLRKRNR